MHQGNMRSGSTMTEYDHAVAEMPAIDPDEITSVKFRNGQIKIRGAKKP
mgnify:CR=1 FL=1